MSGHLMTSAQVWPWPAPVIDSASPLLRHVLRWKLHFEVSMSGPSSTGELGLNHQTLPIQAYRPNIVSLSS